MCNELICILNIEYERGRRQGSAYAAVCVQVIKIHSPHRSPNSRRKSPGKQVVNHYEESENAPQQCKKRGQFFMSIVAGWSLRDPMVRSIWPAILFVRWAIQSCLFWFHGKLAIAGHQQPRSPSCRSQLVKPDERNKQILFLFSNHKSVGSKSQKVCVGIWDDRGKGSPNLEVW